MSQYECPLFSSPFFRVINDQVTTFPCRTLDRFAFISQYSRLSWIVHLDSITLRVITCCSSCGTLSTSGVKIYFYISYTNEWDSNLMLGLIWNWISTFTNGSFIRPTPTIFFSTKCTVMGGNNDIQLTT